MTGPDVPTPKDVNDLLKNSQLLFRSAVLTEVAWHLRQIDFSKVAGSEEYRAGYKAALSDCFEQLRKAQDGNT